MTAKHIAVVLDGNRRYAKAHRLPLYKGHEKGAQNVRNFLKWAEELGVKEVTLYSFSMQNFRRPKEEVGYLFRLFENVFRKLLNAIKKGKDKLVSLIKVNFIGKISLFPKRIQQLIRTLVEKTKFNSGLKVNFAFGYGGREEIVDAVRRILRKGVKRIDEKTISENLYLNSEPDLVIRTGGEQRTSNFLPWQTTYSEWFFVKKTWPEFNRTDLKRILAQFSLRERRFGA
jgi:undecaprenyl diphosphate synthase